MAAGISAIALAACNSGSSPYTTTGWTAPMGHVTNQLAEPKRSVAAARFLPAIPWSGRNSPGNLLYVSDALDNYLSAFRWPGLTEVGQVSGLLQPQGECVNATGDVWVAVTTSQQIAEYAHWGGKRLATLREPGDWPVSCAIDRRTGDLAVGNIATTGSGPGSLAIYRRASGKPIVYRVPSLANVYFVGYMPNGELFVDGLTRKKSFALARLSGKKFTPVTIGGATIAFPGAIQYADHSLTVGDQGSLGSNSTLYRITPSGHVTGTTQLLQSSDCVQTYIKGTTVVCPDAGSGSIYLYAYPAGGNPTKQLSSYGEPEGAVISD